MKHSFSLSMFILQNRLLLFGITNEIDFILLIASWKPQVI